jgi:uncharacterized protein (TIGR03083 family)
VLNRDTYLTSLRSDAAAFADLLRDADLATPVPDCPGWDAGDLARHLGGIHRWAHGVVTTGSPGDAPDGPSDAVELHAWFVDGAEHLVVALRDTDPATPVWTFGPKPRLVEFWVRRQPHETSMHLRDLRQALGLPHAVDAAFAADGVDEVVTMMAPRQVRLERIPPLPHGVRLEAVDVPGAVWVLADDVTDPGAQTEVTLSGTAENLLLALWRRTGIERLTVTGDAAAAERTLALALTP